MFRTVDLVKTFEHRGSRIEALRGVSIDVPEGAIHGIVGPSGAGKSTLIRCLNLLERPTSGQVVLDDIDLTQLSGRELRERRRSIGMVFQHFHLLSSRSVLSNVTFPLEIQGMDRTERRARGLEVLELVGLADRADDRPSRLSGGQKQRVGIARALAGSPRILLCDEPTSALDSRSTEQILDLLGEINSRLGVTVVIITHEMSVVRRICTSASLLEKGRVVDSGLLTELVADPLSPLGALILPFPTDAPTRGGERLLLTFTDAHMTSPVLSRVAKDLDVELTLLGGGVERIGGQNVGRLQITVSDGCGVGTGVGVTDVATYLSGHGFHTEVLR